MAIKLRSDEVIKIKTTLHPMFHRAALVWAIFWTLPVLGAFGPGRGPQVISMLIASILFGWSVFALFYLRYRFNGYFVTNQRIYIEEGVLNKKVRDIPLAKVNDVEFAQSLVDRINKTGRLRILTGNDRGTVIREIVGVEDFREAVVSSLVLHSKAG